MPADVTTAQATTPTVTSIALPTVSAPQAPAPTQAAAPAQAPDGTERADRSAARPAAGARLTALTGPGGLSQGRHILTVPVDPENLGPVRIVAHISPTSVRVELVGSTDASREALKGALADLRKDLAASGLTVDVGSDSRPDPRGSNSGLTGSFEGSGNRGPRNGSTLGRVGSARSRDHHTDPRPCPGRPEPRPRPLRPGHPTSTEDP